MLQAKKDSVKVVQGDGSLDYSKTEVKDGDTVTVSASGYADFSFCFTNEKTYMYTQVLPGLNTGLPRMYTMQAPPLLLKKKDRRGESDLGAFDAVTRATANHGLHRGSFQAIAVL